MPETIVKAENLQKSFGKYLAVKGISFTIDRGDIYGFIGRNGAGKTTVMRMLCGLMRPSAGSIHVLGTKPGGEHALRTGYVPQSIRFDDNRNVRDILSFFANLKRGNVEDAIGQAGDMGLEPDKKAGTLSPGQQRKLQLAVATIGGPDLLILDEPTAGLDPVGVQQVREIIRGMNAAGCTVFISSHVLQELDNLCNKVAVIEAGTLLYQGPCDSVYELEADGCPQALPVCLQSRFPGLCTVMEGRIYAHIDRLDVPSLLAMLQECGVPVFSVKRLGLERFYNTLVKEGA